MITFHATRVLCYSFLCTSITENKLPQYTYKVFNWVIEELREDELLYISNVMSDIGCRVYDIKNSNLGIDLGGSFFMNQIQGLCALRILCKHLV